MQSVDGDALFEGLAAREFAAQWLCERSLSWEVRLVVQGCAFGVVPQRWCVRAADVESCFSPELDQFRAVRG